MLRFCNRRLFSLGLLGKHLSSINQLSEIGGCPMVCNGREMVECYEMRIINLHNHFVRNKT